MKRSLLILLIGVAILSTRLSASPTVYTDELSFTSAAPIAHVSDFEDIGLSSGNPFTYEGVTYTTWVQGLPGTPHGTFTRDPSPVSGLYGIANNSVPRAALSFGTDPVGRNQMVTAIGFYVYPMFPREFTGEIILTNPNGQTFVESFYVGSDFAAVYRGFVDLQGIVSVELTRPPGGFSPNQGIDLLSRSMIEVVPEPSTVVLSVGGLLTLSIVGRCWGSQRRLRADAP